MLASVPTNAEYALTILHELQVYQVEVELDLHNMRSLT